MDENQSRLFDSALITDFRIDDDIPINNPNKQKIHPIVKVFYEKYT